MSQSGRPKEPGLRNPPPRLLGAQCRVPTLYQVQTPEKQNQIDTIRFVWDLAHKKQNKFESAD